MSLIGNLTVSVVSVAAALGLVALVDAVFYAGARIDLFFNPWIYDVSMPWWNAFTTQHYMSWLLVANPGAWLLITTVLSGIVVAVVILGFGGRS